MSGKFTVPGGLSLKDTGAELSVLGETIIARVAGQLQQSSDGSAFSALGGGGGFGSDTIIQLPNAISANVTSLELVNSLLVNTAGAETGRWLIKTILAGTPGVVAQDIRGNQTLFPTGTNLLPGVSFAGSFNNYGMGVDTGTSQLVFSTNGAFCCLWDTAGRLTLPKDASQIIMGSIGQLKVGANGLALQLYSNLDNVEIGVDGAMTTTATTGYLTIPSCAGAPTGVPVPKSGKVALHYDSTNNQIYVWNGSWRKTVALT